MRILDYKLRGLHKETIQMPSGANILSVAVVEGRLTMWAEVCTATEFLTVARTFILLRTGEEVCPNKLRAFIGTLPDANFTYHLYEAF